MADADYDGLGGGQPGGGQVAHAFGPGAQRMVTLAGAAASLALVVGFGFWGYRLAVRDVQGVPVIQALDGPMRITPNDPGGEIVDYQGLAVNNVAAVGAAAPLPDELILAPRPVELTEEDTAGLAGTMPSGPALAVAPAAPLPGAAAIALAAAPPTESASPTEVAVDAALAEALGLLPEDVISDPAADVALEPAPALTEDGIAPDTAMAVSPRPKARPDSRSASPSDTAATDAPTNADLAEVDPATIPAGTRLVQFGAFDTADEARAEWVRLTGRFGELLASKGMVLQPAESGGRTFYRLRAHGFDDEDDARRFCSAFVAQNATCIPVPQR
ncbi:MAG: SPOR domain-containing protein [Rhodobacterales bacterium]|nr:SPOR domain-containing protein [Rhodobacterales bacterium]